MATTDEKRFSDAVYENALAAAGQKPTYAGKFEAQLNDIYDKIQNREAFSYDVNADPLYQNYKDQYIQGGKLAMKDTMGQAAALTGGYGNTYGQQVGQQAYNAYLQNLSAVIPELYGMAYNQYKDEGDNLKDLYAMAGQQRDQEYGRYRDELGDWQDAMNRGLENERYEREYSRQAEQEEYNRQQTADKIARELEEQAYNREIYADQTAYNRSQDEYNRQMAEEAQRYQRQQEARTNITNAIKASGYMPSDAELAAAGMTRAEANAMRDEFNRKVAAEQAAADLEERKLQASIDAANRAAASGGGGGGSYSRGGGGGGGSDWVTETVNMPQVIYQQAPQTSYGFEDAARVYDNARASGNSRAASLALRDAQQEGIITNAERKYIIQNNRVKDRL